MRESVVRDFFVGVLSAQQLDRALAGVLFRVGDGVSVRPECDLREDFQVLPQHLVSVCDAVLSGAFPADRLPALGLFLIASESFAWGSETEDGAVVAETLHDWAAPEVNFPLTNRNIRAFRQRLLHRPFQFDLRHVPA